MNAKATPVKSAAGTSNGCGCGKADEVSANPFVKQMEMTAEMIDYCIKLQCDLIGNHSVMSQLWLDWWKQSESLMQCWSNTQMEMGSAWLHSETPFTPWSLGKESHDAGSLGGYWRDATTKTLHLQNEWLRMCGSMLAGNSDQSATSGETADLGLTSAQEREPTELIQTPVARSRSTHTDKAA